MEIYHHTDNFYNFLGHIFQIWGDFQTQSDQNYNCYSRYKCLFIIMHQLQKARGVSWIIIDMRYHRRAWQQVLFCISRSRNMLEQSKQSVHELLIIHCQPKLLWFCGDWSNDTSLIPRAEVHAWYGWRKVGIVLTKNQEKPWCQLHTFLGHASTYDKFKVSPG